jgi:hypothetical protein
MSYFFVNNFLKNKIHHRTLNTIHSKYPFLSSRKVDIVRAKPSITNNADDQHLSPINNTRRSQFAPVLSSTPVHQTSPITPIPVDLSSMYLSFVNQNIK